MAHYIIKDWLSRVVFQDMVQYGLIKSFYINIKKNYANKNFKLMGIVLNKIFLLDESPFEDEILQPFNKLYQMKKDKIKMFYMELIDIPEIKGLSLESIFEEHNTRKF